MRIGFNSVKVAERLREGSLLLTTTSTGVPGKHFINSQEWKAYSIHWLVRILYYGKSFLCISNKFPTKSGNDLKKPATSKKTNNENFEKFLYAFNELHFSQTSELQIGKFNHFKSWIFFWEKIKFKYLYSRHIRASPGFVMKIKIIYQKELNLTIESKDTSVGFPWI